MEALNSACLLGCQKEESPPAQMSLGLRAFSWCLQGIQTSLHLVEMKDDPAFKPVQGNPAFFQVSVSWCLFHLRQQTQGPSQTPIDEGNLLLRCLWKVGLPLQSKPGNQLSSQDNLACVELSSPCSAEFGVPLSFRRLSQGISGLL